jgi:hypothetical protein
MEEASVMRRVPALVVVFAVLAPFPAVAAIGGEADTPDAVQGEGARRKRKTWRSGQNGPPAGGGAVYGLGMIGAMVYYLGTARSAWDYVLAIPKASVWPALLVYKLLKGFQG